jgi:hypothetical protein
MRRLCGGVAAAAVVATVISSQGIFNSGDFVSAGTVSGQPQVGHGIEAPASAESIVSRRPHKHGTKTVAMAIPLNGSSRNAADVPIRHVPLRQRRWQSFSGLVNLFGNAKLT